VRTAAGLLSILTGLGFGLPCLAAIRHFTATGEVWTFLGFPTYGGGPFERVGLSTTVPLLVAFLLVCVAEAVVGAMLVAGVPFAPAISYGLLPVELAFWIGFAVPAGPVLALARTTLLILASRSLQAVSS
jgi:hypothetical protein